MAAIAWHDRFEEASSVDDMVQACHRGPPLARVAGVAVTPASFPHDETFEQRSTY